jgi:hypothetical protein
MKILQVIFYTLNWIALIILTVLITKEVHSDNKKIIMFILIGLIAVKLIFEGRQISNLTKRQLNKIKD